MTQTEKVFQQLVKAAIRDEYVVFEDILKEYPTVVFFRNHLHESILPMCLKLGKMKFVEQIVDSCVLYIKNTPNINTQQQTSSFFSWLKDEYRSFQHALYLVNDVFMGIQVGIPDFIELKKIHDADVMFQKLVREKYNIYLSKCPRCGKVSSVTFLSAEAQRCESCEKIVTKQDDKAKRPLSDDVWSSIWVDVMKKTLLK